MQRAVGIFRRKHKSSERNVLLSLRERDAKPDALHAKRGEYVKSTFPPAGISRCAKLYGFFAGVFAGFFFSREETCFGCFAGFSLMTGFTVPAFSDGSANGSSSAAFSLATGSALAAFSGDF